MGCGVGEFSLPGPRTELALVLGLLAGLSLLFLNAPGTTDVDGFFLRWMDHLAARGPIAGFARIRMDYPPLSSLQLWAVAEVADALGVGRFVLLKVLLAAAGLLASLLLAAWQARPLAALALGCVWLPSAILHGYLDVLFLPWLIGAFWALAGGRTALGLALYAVACLVKWQPLIIAPFILAYAWAGPAGTLRRLAPALLIGAAVLLAYGVMPVLAALGKALGRDFISGDALNLPWLVTAWMEYHGLAGTTLADNGQVQNLMRLQDFPLLQAVAKLALVAVYGHLLLAYGRSRRGVDALLACSLAGYLAYFVLNTGVHENHLFVAAVLAVLAALRLQACAVLGTAIVLLATVNLFIFNGLSGRGLGFVRVVAGLDGTVPLAVLTIALLAAALALAYGSTGATRPVAGGIPTGHGRDALA